MNGESEIKRDPLMVLGRAKGYSKEELLKNLPRHKNFSSALVKQIHSIPEVIFRNSGTPIAKKINRMMREVSTEAYRAKQFTRTEINSRGVLFGVVMLKHRVVDRVLDYFHKRWPTSIICLYNEYSKITSIIDERGKIQEIVSPLKEVVEKVSKIRPIMPYFEDIQFSGNEIYKTLYNSQFIPERENQTYFKQMIPKKCFNLPGMRNGIEKRFRYKKLDDFTQ